MSLFNFNESYDYDDNRVYLEEGYYDFNEIADWVLENLDEDTKYKQYLRNNHPKLRATNSEVRALARGESLGRRSRGPKYYREGLGGSRDKNHPDFDVPDTGRHFDDRKVGRYRYPMNSI